MKKLREMGLNDLSLKLFMENSNRYKEILKNMKDLALEDGVDIEYVDSFNLNILAEQLSDINIRTIKKLEKELKKESNIKFIEVFLREYCIDDEDKGESIRLVKSAYLSYLYYNMVIVKYDRFYVEQSFKRYSIDNPSEFYTILQKLQNKTNKLRNRSTKVEIIYS